MDIGEVNGRKVCRYPQNRAREHETKDCSRWLKKRIDAKMESQWNSR
jgi:hypothetical protein